MLITNGGPCQATLVDLLTHAGSCKAAQVDLRLRMVDLRMCLHIDATQMCASEHCGRRHSTRHTRVRTCFRVRLVATKEHPRTGQTCANSFRLRRRFARRSAVWRVRYSPRHDRQFLPAWVRLRFFGFLARCPLAAPTPLSPRLSSVAVASRRDGHRRRNKGRHSGSDAARDLRAELQGCVWRKCTGRKAPSAGV